MTVTLVTGCSGGLGLALAVACARAGHRVFATMRDPGKRAALDAALAGLPAEVLALDVQDPASVNAAVAEVLARAGRIDGLVNNAGTGFARTLEHASEAEIEAVLDVNLRGVMRVTRAVLPAMRAARSGRVVTVSSVGGLVGQPFNEIYCAAKFGVEGFVESLATYVGPAFGLHFTLVEPGGIHSDFAPAVMRQFMAAGGIVEDDYAPLLRAYLAGVRARSAAGAESTYQTADEVAAVILRVLSDPAPPVRLRTSDWAERFTALKTSADPDGTQQRDAVVRLNFGNGFGA